MKKEKTCKEWVPAISSYKKYPKFCETCLYKFDNETPKFAGSGLLAILGCPAKKI